MAIVATSNGLGMKFRQRPGFFMDCVKTANEELVLVYFAELKRSKAGDRLATAKAAYVLAILEHAGVL